MMKKRKRMSKKRKILLLYILLCFPIPWSGEEGVVSSYRAVLYSYTRYRVLKSQLLYDRQIFNLSL